MTSLLEVRNISKGFPGVQALSKVSLHLEAGEALALVGENGAGKSTLMKILAGIYQPDEGQILLKGSEFQFASVIDAMKSGISLIHQELNLAENLTVSANIFLGREETFGGLLGLLDRRRMRREAQKYLKQVGLPDSIADATVSNLAPGQKQLVEIARALSMNASILIMDEPTSSLTQTETDCLYKVIDELLLQGVAIIYITHRLGEINRIAHRATILRDGKNAGDLARDQINHENLIRGMVGRELKQIYPRKRVMNQANQPVLELKNFRYEGDQGHPINLLIRPGEVVGMAGLVGAGRTELSEAVFGIRSPLSGEVRINGKVTKIKQPHDAIEAGIALVPEDRRLHGLVLENSVSNNFSLPNYDHLTNYGVIQFAKEKKANQELKDKMGVKTPSLRQGVGLLSGGNQQKVVLGKWIAREPKLLILDEPTRGVDVGARGEIYAIIDQLAAQGLAVWMISSDMEEVLGISDRILVMHEGQLAGELQQAEFSEEAVMRLATGQIHEKRA
jgi:ribose transport system ATP-binding protein